MSQQGTPSPTDDEPHDEQQARPATTPSIARELEAMTVDQFDRRVRRARQQQARLADFEDADGRAE